VQVKVVSHLLEDKVVKIPLVKGVNRKSKGKVEKIPQIKLFKFQKETLQVKMVKTK
jgi:hypothetical protein